jgi:galactose mutarotase-like enzyme
MSVDIFFRDVTNVQDESVYVSLGMHGFWTCNFQQKSANRKQKQKAHPKIYWRITIKLDGNVQV